MDPWKELSAREECRDAVRAWAELEDQTRLVAEELSQKYLAPAQSEFHWRRALGLVAHLAAWAYDCLWSLTRR